MINVSLIKYWDAKVKKMDWLDVGAIKLGVFAIALMIAKLWSPILSLDWYWYLVVFIIAIIRPFKRMYL